MEQQDDALVPASTPRPAKGGLGCVTTAILFVVIVAVGLVVGTVLSGGDDDADERAETIADGVVRDGTAERTWRIDAEVDEAGASCVFLYEAEEQVTGACDDTPQAATLGETTILFGRMAAGRTDAAVELSDGSRQPVEGFDVDGFDERFYVEQLRREVDAVRLVDAAGG
jgi:hypothetical protein